MLGFFYIEYNDLNLIGVAETTVNSSSRVFKNIPMVQLFIQTESVCILTVGPLLERKQWDLKQFRHIR